MIEGEHYSDTNFSVDFFPSIFDEEDAIDWAKHFEYHLHRIDPSTTSSHRRTCLLFGEVPKYVVKYFGQTFERKVLPWDTIPGLLDIKSYIEDICQETFTVCAVQCYRDGKVGINPHRDKEMKPGTKIAGLSFGQERELILTNIYNKKWIDIPLRNGSLYVLLPPTNDKWLHSIPKDKSTNSRISLTFRNYY